MINIRRLEEPLVIEVIPPDREFTAWRVTASDESIIRVFHSKDAATSYAKTLGAPFRVLDRTDEDARWKPFFPRQ